jgi:polyhydroxyalkanoate synthase
MLTGRRARTGTWPIVDAWIDEWGTAPEAPEEEASDDAEAPAEQAADERVLGANPTRRYKSAGSRALRR